MPKPFLWISNTLKTSRKHGPYRSIFAVSRGKEWIVKPFQSVSIVPIVLTVKTKEQCMDSIYTELVNRSFTALSCNQDKENL